MGELNFKSYLKSHQQGLRRIRKLCLVGASVLSVGVVMTVASSFLSEEGIATEQFKPLASSQDLSLRVGLEGLSLLGRQSFAVANFYSSLKILDPSGLKLVSLGCDNRGNCQYSNAHVADRKEVLEGWLVCPIDRFGACTHAR